MSSAEHDPGEAAEVLASAVNLARRVAHSERASLMLPAEDAGDAAAAPELYLAAASGLPDAVPIGARVRLGEAVAGLVAASGRPLLADATANAPAPHPERYRTGAFISVPVPLPDRPAGVLSVADPLDGGGFDAADLAALQALAEHIARDLAVLPAAPAGRSAAAAVQEWRRLRLAAQEEERARLARELHDEAGQALTAALFQLDWEAQRVPAELAGAHAALGRVRAGLVGCAATLHQVAFALRPRILEDLGLAAALRSLVAQVEGAGGPAIALAIEGEAPALDEALELAVFRVAQEGLTNVRKHARAGRAWVRLRLVAGGVELSAEDDRVGPAAAGAAVDGR